MSSRLVVHNPVASPELVLAITSAPRLSDLRGKRIGLYWNMKPGGKAALDRVEMILTARYPGVTITRLQGSVGASVRHLTDSDADAIAGDCDAVVGTTGDCGGCTLWLSHDMKELEKRRVPTVALVAEGFVPDYRRAAESAGIPDLSFATLSNPTANQSPETIHAIVDAAFDGILQGLAGTSLDRKNGRSQFLSRSEHTFTFDGNDLLDAHDRMNWQFREWQYSDGLILRPPTANAVELMLTGTDRSPDEVVGVLEPGRGIGTVEKVAVNAVMAGCEPIHLPIVIAAVECLADPRSTREKVISTGPAAPMLVVNGPVRHDAGLNTGICMLGPGSPSFANTVIGRAVRLCMMNIGHAYPGIADMDTMGSPIKYSMCVAENEEHSPWAPYHVTEGYEPEESTVTVNYIYGLMDLHDSESTVPENLVKVLATASTYTGANSAGYWLMGRRQDPRFATEEQEFHFLLLSPQHAQIFDKAGWSKSDISVAFYREARVRFGFLTMNKRAHSIRASHPELNWLWDSPDTLVPVLEDVNCFKVVVAGTHGSNRTSYAWGMGGAVTKRVETRGSAHA